MSKSLRALVASLALVLATPWGAAGQQLLDWTVRVRVEPEALSHGAEAAFWNPAGLGLAPARGEALAVVLQTASDLGLKALAAGGALRLHGGTAVGAGYQHFGIDDIERTTTAPPEGAADLMSVGEDRLTLGAAQPLGGGRRAWVGAQVEYDRASSGLGTTDGFAFGAGALVRGGGALVPELGVSAVALTGSTRWRVGAGAAVPGTSRLPVALHAAYGLTGQSDRAGQPAQRLALTGSWRDEVVASVAGMAEKSDGTTAYTAAWLGELRLGRYLLGVVHESLANDFGGATSVHLGVRF